MLVKEELKNNGDIKNKDEIIIEKKEEKEEKEEKIEKKDSKTILDFDSLGEMLNLQPLNNNKEEEIKIEEKKEEENEIQINKIEDNKR